MTALGPFTGAVICLCTETWNVMPQCEGETEPRYAYGFWVHPECTLHVGRLLELQKEVKAWRDEA